jgi:sugar phosphate isomerase/epimerase
MTLCLHQTTCQGSGFRGSLEGWARAGVRQVELAGAMLGRFLETESLATARRLIDDLGVTVVSAGTMATDLLVVRPGRAAALDLWKMRCDQFAALGSPKIYCPITCTGPVTAEDHAAAPGHIYGIGELARERGLEAMLEFLRAPGLVSTLPTLLRLIREAGHPKVRPMLDTYHFWSGLNKFEDLDLLRPGELAHVHLSDVPDMPRELLTLATRTIPGEGVAPLDRILRKLSEKGYDGPLSVELMDAELQQADPYQVAVRLIEKCGAVMRRAAVAAA